MEGFWSHFVADQKIYGGIRRRTCASMLMEHKQRFRSLLKRSWSTEKRMNHSYFGTCSPSISFPQVWGLSSVTQCAGWAGPSGPAAAQRADNGAAWLREHSSASIRLSNPRCPPTPPRQESEAIIPARVATSCPAGADRFHSAGCIVVLTQQENKNLVLLHQTFMKVD